MKNIKLEMDEILGSKYVVDSVLPHWILDVETQAVIIAGLCCVGAWVIFKWAVQILFSVLWPFFVVAAIMIFMPSLRKTFARHYIPVHVQYLRGWVDRFTNGFNSTCPS